MFTDDRGLEWNFNASSMWTRKERIMEALKLFSTLMAIGIPILLAIAAVKHKNGKAEHFFVAACSLAVVLAILSK